jgi:hypothetical protein
LRWKLLLPTSLAAALVGAGVSYGLAYLLYRFRRPYPATLTVLTIVELTCLALGAGASVFVYRHTARRRKLQALLALLLSLLLAYVFIRLASSLVPLFVKSQD